MNILGFTMLLVFVLFQESSCGCCGARTGLNTPTPGGASLNCCNTPTAFGPITIAANVTQVPVELINCNANLEEITAIVISGVIAGCATDSTGLTFSNLTLVITTDGARCLGRRAVRTSTVNLTDVRYTGRLRLDVSPSCVSESSVAPRFGVSSTDTGFANLFALNGPETLRPILNHLALRWASTLPGSCPPSPVLGTAPGTTTSFPH